MFGDWELGDHGELEKCSAFWSDRTWRIGDKLFGDLELACSANWRNRSVIWRSVSRAYWRPSWSGLHLASGSWSL